MSSIFTLWGEIAIDAAKAESTIDKTTKSASDLASTMESAGDKFSKALSGKVIAKSVALGNILADLGRKAANLAFNLGKDAIEAAASIQAETAQFASSFGDLADAANVAFASIQKDTNIVSGRLKAVGIKAFSQFKGAGLEAVEALGQMDTYIRLVADSAAYYDISLEDADERMRSFLRGNTEAGDAIGLFTSEMQRNAYAVELYGKDWLDLNEAQRQMLMLEVANDIYEQSGAIGQASRESHSWANVLGNLSRTWNEALAKLGGPLMNELIPVIERFSAWLSNNPEKVEALANTIGKIAGVTLDGLISAFEWLTANGDAVCDLITKIGGALGKVFGFGNDEGASVADAVGQVSSAVSKKTGSGFLGMLSGVITQSSMVNPDAPWLAGLGSFGTGAVTLNASEDSEGNVQGDVDGFDLEGDVLLDAASGSEQNIQNECDNMNLEAEVTLKAKMSGFSGWLAGLFGGADGSHADGLERVPFDGYRAILHKDEMVLRASEAAVYRGEKQPKASAFNRRNTRETSDQPITVNLTVNGNSGSPYEIAGAVRDALEMVRWGV